MSPPPVDAPSPTPSNMPPPNAKRPRNAGTPSLPAAAGGNGGGSNAARTKRKKPEGSVGPESTTSDTRDRRPVSFGVGMVKGREGEWSEPADVKTKINFLDLPTEALYRYLEVHDLLPRWDVSPWSEEPCTPPTALYTIPPPPPVVPIHPASPKKADGMDVDSAVPAVEPAPAPVPPPAPAPVAEAPEARPVEGDVDGPKPELNDDEAAAEAAQDEETNAPPTTRSKTAPLRKATTPELSPQPPRVKRGVMTLSDVHAARAILAEKANAHWVKGLGGGQNREGETIVNFLYKNKVGHGRLLRVYNPTPAPFA
ncbi:hypothetical protein Q8F55_002263 [Vanrija albida]|uniref:Uncharacterized protein n=1 Tax=Vanrija albida TaxID=181172 RepID=A0ABR3Q9J5_9TREE